MKRIMVIDDDAAIIAALSDALTEFGYSVKAALDSRNLRARIREFKPDLILLDFMLTDSNGGAICHQLKSDPQTSELPVIMMSGFNDVRYFAEKSGCDAFIKKPFDLFELDLKIASCLRKNSHLV